MFLGIKGFPVLDTDFEPGIFELASSNWQAATWLSRGWGRVFVPFSTSSGRAELRQKQRIAGF